MKEEALDLASEAVSLRQRPAVGSPDDVAISDRPSHQSERAPVRPRSVRPGARQRGRSHRGAAPDRGETAGHGFAHARRGGSACGPRQARPLGALPEALQEATESVAQARDLVAVNPAGFMPLLGKALTSSPARKPRTGARRSRSRRRRKRSTCSGGCSQKRGRRSSPISRRACTRSRGFSRSRGPARGRGRGGDRSDRFVRRAGLGLPRGVRGQARGRAGAVAPRLELVLQVQEPDRAAGRDWPVGRGF